jgi:bisanhydrobacterioruberin hydratase
MKGIMRLLSKEGLPYTFVVFYCVGLAMFIFPITRTLFIQITPYTLLLVAFAVFYHHSGWNRKTILIFFSIFIFSFFAECIGVATGKVFGIYNYNIGLGYKLFEVPILIGLNWVLLVYGSNGILSGITQNKVLIVTGASVLMILYDIVLEKAAPLMKMWQFEHNQPPIQNYLVWFALAVIFHSIITLFNVNTNNKTAKALFIIQFFFFCFIVAYSLIFIK